MNDNALELPACTPPNAKGFGLTVAIPLPPPPPEVVTVVGFVALAVADPPPDTLTEFVTDAAALLATFTVTVIVELAPATNTVLFVQVFAAHAQPVPAMDTSVNPAGIVSVTVMVPLVGPAFAPFDTVTVYVAFCWPCVKFPVCVFVIANAGGIALPAAKVTITGVKVPLIATVQVGGFVCGLAGVQFVLKLVSVEPPVGVAVSTTWLPSEKLAEQVVVGQVIPVGLLVTVPVPVPASVTVSVSPITWHSNEESPGFAPLLEITSASHPEAT